MKISYASMKQYMPLKTMLEVINLQITSNINCNYFNYSIIHDHIAHHVTYITLYYTIILTHHHLVLLTNNPRLL